MMKETAIQVQHAQLNKFLKEIKEETEKGYEIIKNIGVMRSSEEQYMIEAMNIAFKRIKAYTTKQIKRMTNANVMNTTGPNVLAATIEEIVDIEEKAKEV